MPHRNSDSDHADFGLLHGESAAMRTMYEQLARVGPTDTSVLIVGQSGTGKELIARTLHTLSLRRDRLFIPVNCGAIPSSLIEAELFGHERGSFTGAHGLHIGYFEHASGGTIFLDEVTEMAADMQVRLLRVLESGRFHRVGGTEPIDVDLRVVAATNRDPLQAVAEGVFREDLLYRLAVFPVRVPPLAERSDDIERLALHFVAQLNQQAGTAKRLPPHTLAALRERAWPGNVRELRNVLHRAFILSGDEIELDGVDGDARAPQPPTLVDETLRVWVGTSLEQARRALVRATLAQAGGDRRRAAAMLGIGTRALASRLDEADDETAR